MTPIVVKTWPDEATRTANSACAWVAEATVDGRTYTARSRHGAANELARQLVVAGVVDRPMVIHYRGLAGTMTYRSFHAAAKSTYSEGNQPLRRVRHKEQPEGLFLRSGEDENASRRPLDDIVAIPGSVTPKITAGTEERPCATCGRFFRLWRPQAAYCSPPCRQKAYRQRMASATGMPVEETTL